MINTVKSLYTNHFNRLFLFFVFFLLVFAVIFYVALGRGAAESLTNQVKDRQLILAKTGADILKSAIDLYGMSIVTLAEGPLDQENLENFVANWDGRPVGGVIVIDRSGRVSANASRNGIPDVGVDLWDRDYFVWAKTAKKGEYFISNPIVSRVGASKNKYVAIVATPLIAEAKFNGVVALSIILEEFTDAYLHSLKASPATRIYLVNRDTTILAGPYPELIGKSTVEYIRESKFLGSEMVANLVQSNVAKLTEGTLDIVVPDFRTKSFTRMLIAYAPVMCCQEGWLLGIMTPASDLTAFFAPLYINQLGVIVVAFLVLIVVSILVARDAGFREGFCRRFEKDTVNSKELPPRE